MNDDNKTAIDEKVILSKFNGEALPENEFERIHIHNGVIVAWEQIENGEVVKREAKEVD